MDRRSKGIEELIRQAAWENERVVNWFRAGFCLIIAATSIPQNLAMAGHVLPGTWISGSWGLLALLAAPWLRRRYYDWLPYVLATLDISIFLTGLFSVYEGVKQLTDNGATFVLYAGLGLNVMMLIALNMVRFSWGVAVWSAIYGYALYLYLVMHERGWNPGLGFTAVSISMVTGMVYITAKRFRQTLVRMKERDAFERFLPATAVQRLTEDPTVLNLGGEEQEVAILFTDVRGFTAMSSKMTPAQVVRMLNEYFGEMVEVLFEHGGVLDKFIGDGLCAVFGPPDAPREQARKALRCALAMQARLAQLNQRRIARGEPELKIGIGIHAGPVLAGNIGSELRMEYTHIGDSVNTCARIESLTKELGAGILASEACLALAGKEASFKARKMRKMKVKGKARALQVYAIEPPKAGR
jgi:class 3 adenylate cyclase